MRRKKTYYKTIKKNVFKLNIKEERKKEKDL